MEGRGSNSFANLNNLIFDTGDSHPRYALNAKTKLTADTRQPAWPSLRSMITLSIRQRSVVWKRIYIARWTMYLHKRIFISWYNRPQRHLPEKSSCSRFYRPRSTNRPAVLRGHESGYI